MFWDKVSSVYDFFLNAFNHKVFRETGIKVSEFIESSDEVLECACGTGEISKFIAQKCSKLTATDFSYGMLKHAQKKCRAYSNVQFLNADITSLNFSDGSFNKAVAGNVIHLLAEPQKALSELERVVKKGGKLIIPTYINMSKKSGRLAAKLIQKLGAGIKRQFDFESYKKFFSDLGYKNVEYSVVEGRIPCAVAVISIE